MTKGVKGQVEEGVKSNGDKLPKGLHTKQRGLYPRPIVELFLQIHESLHFVEIKWQRALVTHDLTSMGHADNTKKTFVRSYCPTHMHRA